MKKICIIYANCQNQLLAEYLLKSSLFNREYTVKRFPVHILIQNQKTVPDELLERTKLFIYQPVKDIHGINSSKYLLGKLPSDCQRISFPSLYFTGYFPHNCKNPYNKIIQPKYPSGLIPQGDANIISMLEKGKNITEIIESLSDPNFYSREFLLAHLDETLTELTKRESQLSIKVSQFIRENFQNYYLFYTRQHPSDILGIHVVNQILNLLELPKLDNALHLKIANRGVLDSIQLPIYPSVIKHLNLKFADENMTYRHSSFCTNRMTLSRYISEYVKLHLGTSGSSITYFIKGINFLNKNESDRAITALEKAIEIEPNKAKYYVELGEAFKNKNDLDSAELAYRKALSISPEWTEFYILLGKLLVAKDEKIAAITLYRQGLKLEPEHDELNWLLGNLMLELGYLDVAEKHYQQAIASKPAKVDYYSCLGDVFDRKRHFNLALFTYRKGLDIHSRNAWIYIKIASVLVKQNKLDEAIKACKHSITIDSKNSHFYYKLGSIYLQKGDIELGLQSYERAVELNSNQAKEIFQSIRSLIKDIRPLSTSN